MLEVISEPQSHRHPRHPHLCWTSWSLGHDPSIQNGLPLAVCTHTSGTIVSRWWLGLYASYTHVKFLCGARMLWKRGNPPSLKLTQMGHMLAPWILLSGERCRRMACDSTCLVYMHNKPKYSKHTQPYDPLWWIPLPVWYIYICTYI